jgi:hypothetical protein
MLGLICENLIPITFSIGFVNSSFSDVRNTFVAWKTQHLRSITSKQIDLPLGNALKQLQPLTPIPRRWLLVPTTADWVAYFDNGTHGPDPASAVSYLSLKLACRGFVATFVPHTLDTEEGTASGLYGAVQMELFAPHKTISSIASAP